MKIKSFQQLNASQWAWLWVAYWRLWPVLLRIKLKQQSWLMRKIDISEYPFPREEHVSKAGIDIKRMHESVRLAARMHFFDAACLPRSIVLADMLKHRGVVAAKVRLGVGLESSSLASHAWVEVNGEPVAEPERMASDFIRIKR